MQKIALLIGILTCEPLYAQNVAWFEENTPLTQAHQHLLNDDQESMFASLVEVWQLQRNNNIQSHLNDLLIQSFNIDCGKGLDSKPFPEWIKSVLIKRIDIQSPGRNAYQVLIDTKTTDNLSEVTLTKWVDKPLSNDSTFTRPISDNVTEKSYLKRYNVNTALNMGLYRLNIVASEQKSWSAWIIFAESRAKQTVRWASKDQWVVEKNALLNRFCPLPKLNVSIFDYADGNYKEVWNQSYESDYPTSLDVHNLPANRYILAVSLSQQRWQGPIIIEQSQVISKTYDISEEE